MNKILNAIQRIEEQYPELMCSKDLIDLEIIPSQTMAWIRRKNGTGPKFTVMKNGNVIYRKQDVIEWLQSKQHSQKVRTNQEKTKREFLKRIITRFNENWERFNREDCDFNMHVLGCMDEPGKDSHVITKQKEGAAKLLFLEKIFLNK